MTAQDVDKASETRVSTARTPDAPTSHRALIALLLIGNTAVIAVYMGAGVLLAVQAAQISPSGKVAALGTVTGVAALVATLVQPIVGALSDRGERRTPWILGGALAGFGLLAVLADLRTVLLLTVGWCAVSAALNAYQVAIGSVVPDRIPESLRGTASGFVSLGIPLGAFLGPWLAARAAPVSLRTGYLLLGGLVAFAALLLTSLARERRIPGARSAGLRGQLTSLVSALRGRDFRWAFTGRALITLGYFSVAGFQLYIVQDHTVLPEGLSPVEAVAVLSPVGAVAMAVSTGLGGVLSDRTGRRRPFVAGAAIVSAVAALLPVFSDSWSAMLVFAALNGLGFGCFMAVDLAIVTLVLPSASDAARDLGVLNMAQAGPQIVSPLIGSLAVSVLGGFTGLFLVAGAVAVLGSLAMLPIRGVR
ncbi:MFS transporter [Streptomyces sp. HM190]|uniref:MFS transporter n=1 Tax=Streptomyces sp. HM190 TaxID=2695266 RepID=UPI00135BEF38|nr:MFS transporter [Streptomyces sp. HM190]